MSEPRGITYDWPFSREAPGPGDILACVRGDGKPTGTLYLILTSRVVRHRDPLPVDIRLRLRYMVVRVDKIGIDQRVESLRWYSRKQGPPW